LIGAADQGRRRTCFDDFRFAKRHNYLSRRRARLYNAAR
jgi:hypothetical protein